MRYLISFSIFLLATTYSIAQEFTAADSLFGSNTPERAWWDVQHYDLTIEPDPASKTLSGEVSITYRAIDEGRSMQIDLREGMTIDSAKQNGNPLSMQRNGRFYFISGTSDDTANDAQLTLYFSGKPHEAVNPPWDGGWVWSTDEKGRPWMSVACQGTGASVWFPCKDYNGDEPDHGATLRMIIPEDMEGVAGGRRMRAGSAGPGKKMSVWKIVNPVNVYNIIPYIGYYTEWSEPYNGLNGKLNCAYYVLDYNLEKAKQQFQQVPTMLNCFETWFGPYPFYEDGYKLVEAPYLGMEHQSAVAYGNGFQNGYSGRDLSGTGIGLKWDFIIVHESGHEWFGNNISAKDVADMWIHESFTNYSEALFTECQQGKDAANRYVYGIRELILNDRPIIGKYGVRNEGSGDMYYKGGNMIHLIRQFIGDDEKFRRMLTEMNKTFYHQTVTTAEVETFIQSYVDFDLSGFFDVYLRQASLPVLEIRQQKHKAYYRWTNVPDNFTMPLRLRSGEWISPSGKRQKLKVASLAEEISPDFYITVKQMEKAPVQKAFRIGI